MARYVAAPRPAGVADPDATHQGRQLRDRATGRLWFVRAQGADDETSADGAGVTLLAFSQDVVRRLRGAPARWEALDDAALLAVVNGPAIR